MTNKTLIDEPLKVGDVAAIPGEIDARLQIVAGPDTGKILYVEDPITVLGREDDCHMVLDDPRVSNRHAIVYFAGGEFRARDLNSTNGSLINGSPLTECAISDGDDIRLGKTVIRLVVDFREP